MVYKWYILPIGGLYGTYHLLGETETAIETVIILTAPGSLMKLREATDVIVMAVSAVSAFAIRRRDRMRKYDVFFGRKSSKHRNLTHFFGEEKYVFLFGRKE